MATIVSEDPLTIQLTFEPKGRGQNGDAYSLGEKQNQCVVCGTNEDLTRHHIVPYTYRKHFSDTIKSHNSHDVVPICTFHHSEYEENYAIELKRIFAERYDAPLELETKTNSDLSIVVKYAKVLNDHWDTIPYKRKKQMITIIRNYHGYVGRLKHVILTYAYVDLTKTKTESHGEKVVSRVTEENKLQWFVETWREHFLHSMNPQFMPEHWDVHRSIERIG